MSRDDLRTDGGISITAEEFERLKQANSSTPPEQRQRCPECGGADPVRKSNRGNQAQKPGQYRCRRPGCYAHFDEPVTGYESAEAVVEDQEETRELVTDGGQDVEELATRLIEVREELQDIGEHVEQLEIRDREVLVEIFDDQAELCLQLAQALEVRAPFDPQDHKLDDDRVLTDGGQDESYLYLLVVRCPTCDERQRFVEETTAPVALDQDVPLSANYCPNCGSNPGYMGEEWDLLEDAEVERVPPSQIRTDGGRELIPADQHSDESMAFRESWQCSDDLYDELREWAIGHLEANTDWSERIDLSEIQLRKFVFEDGVAHFDATHPHVTHEDEYDGELAPDGGRCQECGETWDENPARKVECPTCGAAVGSPCKRPSGWTCSPHADRYEVAVPVVCPLENCLAAEDEPDQEIVTDGGTSASGSGRGPKVYDCRHCGESTYEYGECDNCGRLEYESYDTGSGRGGGPA